MEINQGTLIRYPTKALKPAVACKVSLHSKLKKKIMIHSHVFFLTESGDFYSCSFTDIQLIEADVISFTCTNRVCYIAKKDGIYSLRATRSRRTVHKWFLVPFWFRRRLEFERFGNFDNTDISDMNNHLICLTSKRTYI
jgi:hypothetical protein